MIRFGFAIFLSAFLLFQVQLIIGKWILPWFGSVPSVWATCMLFFQVLLLAGYAWAHALSRLPVRVQAGLHLAALAASLAFMPIGPSPTWKPGAEDEPVTRILLLLLTNLGVPFFVLSATAPLLQSWFHRVFPERPAYRLYALSNLGSLLALIGYPILIEPLIGLRLQAWSWAGGYLAVAIGIAACALALWRTTPAVPTPASAPVPAALPRLAPGRVAMWLGLSACGSALLLATTNQICYEFAVAPFLWVAPLALYLVSFIICFENPKRYDRRVFGPLLLVAIPLACYALYAGNLMGIWTQIGVYLLALFAGCMVCQGELARLKPEASRSTAFYLAISAGGALGGVFVAVIAPLIFNGFYELNLALGTCGLLTLLAWDADRHQGRVPASRWLWGPLIAWQLAVMFLLIKQVGVSPMPDMKEIATVRNFYGVLRITEQPDPDLGVSRMFWHGRTLHGAQFTSQQYRRQPIYWGPDNIEMAIKGHPRRLAPDGSPRPLRIGIIGLGAGTMAVFAVPGDYLRYYEINPDVIRLHDRYFTFCQDARDLGAKIDIIQGDARIQLERELAAGKPQDFDLLILDAFTSEAIPVHLLTRECVELYWQHLRPDGLLAVNIRTRFVNLDPVVRGMAEYSHCQPLRFQARNPNLVNQGHWLLLGHDLDLRALAAAKLEPRPWTDADQAPLLWTDDYLSLWQVVRMGQTRAAKAGR